MFVITWSLIPIFCIWAILDHRRTRAILTDRAFHTRGGVIDLDQIVDIEHSGGSLKVRGLGSVYRLTGLTDQDELIRMLRERVREARGTV